MNNSSPELRALRERLVTQSGECFDAFLDVFTNDPGRVDMSDEHLYETMRVLVEERLAILGPPGDARAIYRFRWLQNVASLFDEHVPSDPAAIDWSGLHRAIFPNDETAGKAATPLVAFPWEDVLSIAAWDAELRAYLGLCTAHYATTLAERLRQRADEINDAPPT